VIAAVSPGNPFPVVEGPFKRDEFGKIQTSPDDGKSIPNPKGYLGKACQVGYQSHSIVGENLIRNHISFCHSFNIKSHNT